MVKMNKELLKIVNMSMPFPIDVIKAYSQLDMVFTSGDLARISQIPKSTSKFYIRKMVKMRMISKIPYRRKYQKYMNAKIFSDWLLDLIKLVIRPIEET